MHRQARRRLTERHRGGYGAGTSPGGAMGGGGYNDGPGGSTLDSATPQGGYTSNGQPSVQDIVDQELTQAGASPALIRGFHYNINAESGWNPNSREADQPRWGGEAHYAHGLLQEGGPEWAGLQAYAAKNGTSWQDPRTQMQYAVDNLKRSGTWDSLNAAKSWQDAASGLATNYLRPRADLLQARINDIYGRKDFNNPSAAGQPWMGVGTQTGGIPTGSQDVPGTSELMSLTNPKSSETGQQGLLGNSLQLATNPLQLTASLLGKDPMGQQNAPPPGFAPPGGVARPPQVNPQVMQQQQALLQGILHPQFQKFDA